MSNNESVFDVDKKKKKTKKKDKTTNDEDKGSWGEFIFYLIEFIIDIVIEIFD